jgi:hypothetical protein
MINGNELVEKARSLIGKVTYVFGADNIEGGQGDCSSFTSYLYDLYGVDIGRDTQSQWTGIGTKINKSELKTGDLVFFKNTYDSKHTDGVSHVGIYSGGGNFIHLGSKGVQESSLNESYWSSHYLGAKTLDEVEGTADSDGGFIQTGITGLSNKDNIIETIATYVLIALAVIVGVVCIGVSIGGFASGKA